MSGKAYIFLSGVEVSAESYVRKHKACNLYIKAILV
jgi:hypothetical protein